MSDLRDLLDRPLPGEPAHRPPAVVLTGARRRLRRRRLAATGLVAAAVVAAGGATLAAGVPGAGDAAPVVTQPTSVAPERTDTFLRERYPASAALADCLAERGYAVRVGLQGGIGFEGSAAAADQFQVDVVDCRDGLGSSRAQTTAP